MGRQYYSAEVRLGSVDFHITCESCDHQYTVTDQIIATGKSASPAGAKSSTEGKAAILTTKIKEAVSTGNPDRLIKTGQIDIIEKCPQCGYVQSWMQELWADDTGPGCAIGGGIGCLTNLLALPLASAVLRSFGYSPADDFHFFVVAVIAIGLIAVGGGVGAKVGEHYGKQKLEALRRYGTPPPRNPVIRWGDYDPAADPDPPWNRTIRARKLPPDFPIPPDDYELDEDALQKKYGYSKGSAVFERIQSERKRPKPPASPSPGRRSSAADSPVSRKRRVIGSEQKPADDRSAAEPRSPHTTKTPRGNPPSASTHYQCQCPKCGQRMKVRREHTGKRGQCPKCGAAFKISSP